MLSRRADYGVRAMMDIALQQPTERTIVSAIAKRQAIPPPFLAKIVPLLARAGLVRTSLGATGGITLAASPAEISLLQIIEAIDGPFALNLCSLNPSDCHHYATCVACQVWGKAQAQLNQTLARTRLSDLAVTPEFSLTRRAGAAATRRSKPTNTR
jgi:Rrf2 family protein